MKSERRHELEQNQLADWLMSVIERARPHARLIGWTFATLVVVAIVVAGWARYTSAAAKSKWREFYAAMDNAEQLRTFADENSQFEAGQLAALILADQYAERAGREVLRNKVLAQDENRKAMDLYAKVLERPRKLVLEQRALMGLAQAKEIAGDVPEAVKLYEQIRRRWPESVFGIQAQDRLRDLNKQSTKAMYDRLATYDPRPVTPSLTRPTFDPTVPAEPPTAATPGSTLPGTTFDLKLDGPPISPREETKDEHGSDPKNSPPDGSQSRPSVSEKSESDSAGRVEKPSDAASPAAMAPGGSQTPSSPEPPSKSAPDSSEKESPDSSAEGGAANEPSTAATKPTGSAEMPADGGQPNDNAGSKSE